MAAPPPQSLPTNPPAPIQPPRSDPFYLNQLAQFNGQANPRIFIAVKGDVFDVSLARDMYGPGANYHVFAGRDASRALAIGSTNPADVIPNYSGLTQQQLQTLEGWYTHFRLKYSIVGRIVG